MTKLTKAQTMVQAIADDIVHGRLAPGVALDETALAAAYGVSRTPTREALRQLEAIGLVEARARRGAVVADVTGRQLDEMFDVMAEIEAWCARWCAVRMTAAERRHLQEIHEASGAFVADGDRASYIEANNQFHEAIYKGAHNAFLADMALSVRKRVQPFRRAQFETLGRLAKSHFEHGRVTLAIQRGDAEGAARDMRSHIVIVRDQVDVVTRTPEARRVKL
ncbi:GntR family transcriptional regulator [Labrys monachus]|uniref:DNA-binding GntR family transcriptional regulator n=1 Tax=Labrys monachus TaxID=217067 RepID=A0ABU0FE25_9HYPH|nr:GntR family transcriptional regulator [Labrys monachus]MDQ0392373.1 DNA-binding GntR family transcriptional regulator [Labrys monachus]